MRGCSLFTKQWLLLLVLLKGDNAVAFPAWLTRTYNKQHESASLWNFVLYSRNSRSSVGSDVLRTLSALKNNNSVDATRRIQEDWTKYSLIRSLLNVKDGSDLVRVRLAGKADLPTSRNSRGVTETITCAVLVEDGVENDSDKPTKPCLLVPLDVAGESQWKLLQYTSDVEAEKTMPFSRTAPFPRSRITLFGLNAALVNRNNGIFDNLPYSTWSVDPSLTMRDAANNSVAAKFHGGKRRAYNRLITGTDVVTNNSEKEFNPFQFLAENRKNELQNYGVDIMIGTKNPSSESDDLLMLSERIMELRIKELEMDVAELDYKMAIARNDQNELEEMNLGNQKQRVLFSVQESREQLNQLRQNQKSVTQQLSQMTSEPFLMDYNTTLAEVIPKGLRAILISIRDFLVERQGTGNPSARTSNRERDASTLYKDLSRSQYETPYGVIRQIIREQLQAEVIGTVLENSSLLDGTLTLGGLVVLRRLTARKDVKVAGERVTITDDEETFGNIDVPGGQTILIECKADEAIGMSLSCPEEAALWIENDTWCRGCVMVRQDSSRRLSTSNLTQWATVDPELSILLEGQTSNQSSTERVAPIRIPRTSMSLFDRIFDISDNKSNNKNRRQLFPTDNPIKSLNDYDKMSDDDKARTLMTMSNFEGDLPRPRVLRESNSTSSMSALDKLLLPLIDEAVRNQLLIREAVDRDDINEVRKLQQSMSRRQVAKENAEKARQAGLLNEAVRWEKEASLLESLRADVTQDEGTYSRFLDRDEWYERNRQEQAKRIDRKKFGTLLDGIE